MPAAAGDLPVRVATGLSISLATYPFTIHSGDAGACQRAYSCYGIRPSAPDYLSDRRIAMLWLKACARCKTGDVELAKDHYG